MPVYPDIYPGDAVACPYDPADAVETAILWHSHFVICQRHKLKDCWYHSGTSRYEADTDQARAYWAATWAQIANYADMEFPLIPEV